MLPAATRGRRRIFTCRAIRAHVVPDGTASGPVRGGVAESSTGPAGTAVFDRGGPDTPGMVFLVPFDGSPQAETALDRAVTYGAALDTDVVAVSLVPTGSDYAQRRRRVDPTEDFAAETAASDLRRKIEEATDDAELRYEDFSAYSASELSETITQVARDVDASVLFLGSNDTEDVVVPMTEVGDDDAFDVHIVRQR